MRYAIITLILVFFTTGLSAQVNDQIASGLKTGNSRVLAQYLGSTVDLTMDDKEGTYSKAQAELLLKEFFTKNRPRSFNVLHTGESKLGLKYAIGTLITSSGNFRVSLYTKASGSKEVIQSIRFDSE